MHCTVNDKRTHGLTPMSSLLSPEEDNAVRCITSAHNMRVTNALGMHWSHTHHYVQSRYNSTLSYTGNTRNECTFNSSAFNDECTAHDRKDKWCHNHIILTVFRMKQRKCCIIIYTQMSVSNALGLHWYHTHYDVRIIYITIVLKL